jgi:hypothetical protein
MIEQTIRTIAEHPKRTWIVTILTVGFVLVFTWPIVDSYSVASQKRAAAAEQIAGHADLDERLRQFRSQLESRQTQLNVAEEAAVGESDADGLRDRVIGMVKDQGLRLRRIRLGDVTTRPWYEKDSPLWNQIRSESEKKTPFKLRNQPLRIEVSGPMNNVVALLQEISAIPHTIHASGFQMKRAFDDATQIDMDVDLAFFDLVQEPAKK